MANQKKERNEDRKFAELNDNESTISNTSRQRSSRKRFNGSPFPKDKHEDKDPPRTDTNVLNTKQDNQDLDDDSHLSDVDGMDSENEFCSSNEEDNYSVEEHNDVVLDNTNNSEDL